MENKNSSQAGPPERLDTGTAADVLDLVSDAVFAVDGRWKIVYWNPACERLYGWTCDEALGRDSRALLREELAEVADDALKALYAGVFQGEVIQFHKDGSRVRVETRTVPLVDRSGGAAGHIRVNRDLTEQAGLIRRLEESEQRHQLMVKTSAEGVWLADGDEVTTYVNRRTAEMLGYEEGEMLGRHFLDFIFDGDSEEAARNLEQRREEKGGRLEFRFRRKDGAQVWVLISSHPIINEDGSYRGCFSMMTDISDIKKAEEELLNVNEELDAYAHTVSHDLRNPLAAITLANTMLRERARDPVSQGLKDEVRETTRIIDRNLGRAYTLIDEMLALAEAGQRPKTIEEVSISRIVQAILEAFLKEIVERGTGLELAEDLGVVKASPTQMYQLFSNLIDNAIKHNDAAKPVLGLDFLGDDDDGAHRYLIRDNGPGIPADAMNDIFIPFYRKGSGGRWGVGLATVKRIVKLYGGEITVYNDGGACFEFTLRDHDPGQ